MTGWWGWRSATEEEHEMTRKNPLSAERIEWKRSVSSGGKIGLELNAKLTSNRTRKSMGAVGQGSILSKNTLPVFKLVRGSGPGQLDVGVCCEFPPNDWGCMFVHVWGETEDPQKTRSLMIGHH